MPKEEDHNLSQDENFELRRIPIYGATHRGFKGRTCVDLCSGLGGFSLAAQLLGMEPTAAIDVWEKAKTVYMANFPDVPFILGDLLEPRNLEALADAVRDAEGTDLLCAGTPCQGFSQIRNGHHRRTDPRNEVSRGVAKALRAIRPRSFILENVPAMFLYQRGRFMRGVLASLRRPAAGLSYEVAVTIYDAATFGVPQQRRRAFIVGVQKGEGEVHPPQVSSLSWYFTARRRGFKLNGYSSEIDEILSNPLDDRLVTVHQALGDLPVLPAGARETPRAYRKPSEGPYQKGIRGRMRVVRGTGTPRIKRITARRVRALAPGQCVKDLPKGLLGSLERRFASAYRRLHAGLPATTLFTKFDCAYHPTAARALSLREYARLQSIPDWYQFPVAPRHAYAMIGNAIPPLMVARILRSSLTLG